MKYQEFLHNCVQELSLIPETVQEEFSYLSEKQLNWQPNPKSWSILQCLYHLIVSDATYDEVFKKILNKYPKNSVNKEVKFSWLGKWLINSINPQNVNKLSAPKKFQIPKSSNLSKEDVLKNYLERVEILKNYFIDFQGLDLNTIYLSSPALWILRYNLSACIQILTYHHLRHNLQAMKVKQNTKFPYEL
jgi:hypothetical protein